MNIYGAQKGNHNLHTKKNYQYSKAISHLDRRERPWAWSKTGRSPSLHLLVCHLKENNLFLVNIEHETFKLFCTKSRSKTTTVLSVKNVTATEKMVQYKSYVCIQDTTQESWILHKCIAVIPSYQYPSTVSASVILLLICFSQSGKLLGFSTIIGGNSFRIFAPVTRID